ncbi:MAG: T9SS type A sorting domain-containing protein [Saprospiraceae bacterium]
MIHTLRTIFFNLLVLAIGTIGYGQAASGGWADFQAGTTGGASGETVTVTSRNELLAYAGAPDAYTIRIVDTIALSLYEQVTVSSNKTIIGIGLHATIRFGGLQIKGDNVIIRNLIIRDTYDGDWDGKTHSTDAITIYGKHVWVDHCWLAASADGLLDIRSDGSTLVADYTTVSYTRFTDHNKVSLIGSSDESVQDRDHLKATFHHCWFDGTIAKGVNQRMPRVRYGDVHLYNNYYENVGASGVAARIESDVVIERCYFRNCQNPHYIDDTGKGEKDPSLVVVDNVYEFCAGDRESAGEGFIPADYYSFSADEVLRVPTVVMNEAGPFNDPGNHPPVAITDRVTLAKEERSIELTPTENDEDPDGDSLRFGVVINSIQGAYITKENSIRYIAPSHPARPDTLWYEVVDLQGGVDTGMIVINFAALTSVANSLLDKSWSVTPNPASNEITIHCRQSLPGLCTVQLLNMQGKGFPLYTFLQGWDNGQELRLDVAGYPAGIYLLKLTQDAHVSIQKVLLLSP